MSESEKSLEDFFAKKSKKKAGKGKGKKFTTSDEIAKKLVEHDPTSGQSSAGTASSDVTSKKSKQEGSKDKVEDSEKETNLNYRFTDDDEWTDFRDDSQKDYSGLKIQALQITDEQPEGDEEEEEVDENGEPIKGKGQGASGPWNKNPEVAAPPAVAAAPAPEPEAPKEEPKPAATQGKYVPPNKRGAAAGANNPSLGGSSPAAAALRLGGVRNKGKAPQINSEFEFPTLAASSDLVKHSNKGEDATFSTVTRGGQAVDGSASKGGDLQLGNRFAALEN